MKRRFRLTRSTDVQRVRRYGKSYAHPLIVLVVLANETGDVQFAVAAGRSIGNAVLRNRAKRLMRAAINPMIDQVMPGWDAILIARSAILEAEFEDIDAAVKVLLRRAGVLRNSDE